MRKLLLLAGIVSFTGILMQPELKMPSATQMAAKLHIETSNSNAKEEFCNAPISQQLIASVDISRLSKINYTNNLTGVFAPQNVFGKDTTNLAVFTGVSKKTTKKKSKTNREKRQQLSNSIQKVFAKNQKRQTLNIPTDTTTISFNQQIIDPSTLSGEAVLSLKEKVIDLGKQFLGLRYRRGGVTPKGFDCSGFVYYIFKEMGILIPRGGDSQAKMGKVVSMQEARPGDLIVFGWKRGSSYSVTHVGLIISNDNGHFKMIHSSRRGIVIDDSHSSSWQNYYDGKFLFIKRLF